MIAARMKHLQASGIRKMFELASKMKNPIDLSLGQPDFDVPEQVKKEAISAINQGYNKYTLTAGIPELISSIKESLYNEGVFAEEVMSTAGASGGLLLSLFALVDAGTEVLITDPGFVTYGHLIRMCGGEPKRIDTYPNFKLTPKMLEDSVTDNTKVLIFNSPVNPTGVAYTGAEISDLSKTAKRLKLQVISDEVYDIFCYDFKHESWLKYDKDAVLIRSLSKTGGMPGWRSGYAAGPKEIIEQMIMLQQFTFVCVNSPTQWASIAALKNDVSAIVNRYKEKRDLIYNNLKDHYSIIKPQGAFYAFVKAPNGDMDNFLKKCIAKELLIVPGSAFSQYNTHFRISYATENKVLKKGIDILISLL